MASSYHITVPPKSKEADQEQPAQTTESSTGNWFFDAVNGALNGLVDKIQEAQQNPQPVEQQPVGSYQDYQPTVSGFFDQYAYNLAGKPKEYAPIYSTSNADRKAYRDYFDSKGGIKQDYESGFDTVGKALGNMAAYNYTAPTPDELDRKVNDLGSGLSKIAADSIDDGTMNPDSIRSKYMDGKTYKELAGMFGGRNVDDIDEQKVYNKLEEMRDYGFRPYVEDGNQYASWLATQAADDNSKVFNRFSRAREAITDATYDFGDGKSGISRKELNEHLGDYSENVLANLETNPEILYSAADVDPDHAVGYVSRAVFPGKGADGSDVVAYLPDSSGLDKYVYKDPYGRVVVAIPGYDSIVYDPGLQEDVEAWENKLLSVAPEYYATIQDEMDGYAPAGEKPIVGYLPAPDLEYVQSDGRQVDLSINDIIDLVNGNVDADYGFGNIAKNSDERKGWTEMLTTMDFSDILPNMVDLVTGSAPLFFSPVAWAQSGSNAVTAAQGLDSRFYDYTDNTYRRLPGNYDPENPEGDQVNPDQYYLNLVLSGLTPLTERLAGGIGGSGGILGKPLQNLLKKHNAPAASRYLTDILGEGAEEIVASTWEDLQTNGLANWFADPLYETDEYGNVVMEMNFSTGKMEPKIKKDSTGLEMRDPSTPPEKRVLNFLEQAPENAIAGSALGLGLIGPRAVSDRLTSSGYYASKLSDSVLRDAERRNGLKHFRGASKHGNVAPNITEDDIGTYRSYREGGR